MSNITWADLRKRSITLQIGPAHDLHGFLPLSRHIVGDAAAATTIDPMQLLDLPTIRGVVGLFPAKVDPGPRRAQRHESLCLEGSALRVFSLRHWRMRHAL
ncbi:MAG: hypothetical protein R3F54_32130 [Alphaproteobacteria bacterium]